MNAKREPAWADLVHNVIREAEGPLAFRELFDRVNARRPIGTRKPEATIRSALTASSLAVSLGDGTYGYLPRLLEGSVLRLSLREKKPANFPLIYSDEVIQVLWPGSFGGNKRQLLRPVHLQISGKDEVRLCRDLLGLGAWGMPMPEGLRQYLVGNRASAGDSLLIRVTDGEAGDGEVWFEAKSKLDKAAVSRRDREVADMAHAILSRTPQSVVLPSELATRLLARGAYRSPIAPHELSEVLGADERFFGAGFGTWRLSADMTPEMRESADALLRVERDLGGPAFGAEPEAKPVDPAAVRTQMERLLRDVSALLAQHDFASDEEVGAFLNDAMRAGAIPHRAASTPLEKAQELAFQAMEARTSRERVRLARKALETSPDCADAYVILAEETATSPEQAAAMYTEGVTAGERGLGPGVFEEAVGEFWGLIETRPYMRARLGLAMALAASGKAVEAIAHLWDMLRLNPGDNQGVRYLLLAMLLEQGDDAEVRRLLDLYPDDAAASWSYGAALYAFRTEGDTAHARKLRAEAVRANRYAPAYLAGKARAPAQMPGLIGFGGRDEAVTVADEQLAAWQATPGATAWLQQGSR